MDYEKLNEFVNTPLTKEIKNQLNEEELTYIRKKKRINGIKLCNQRKYHNNNDFKFKRLMTWFNNKYKGNEEYMKIIENADLTPEMKYYQVKMFSASMDATMKMMKLTAKMNMNMN